MFKIQLSPVAGSKDTAISANGNILTINGLEIDFSPLAEGEQCETELPLIGMAKRVGGVISVTVMYEYDSATAEPMQSMNAADYVIELTDGPANDVIVRRPIVDLVMPTECEDDLDA